jgi:hypothetical protein
MTHKDEALKLALDAWQTSVYGSESHHKAMLLAMTNMAQALAAQPAVQPVAHSYTSTQATTCACCGEHKHTPLRIDKMGGYVCLTCIDKKLGSLLGEFGHPPAQPAVQEPSFKEWTQDYVRDNIHKLKAAPPAQPAVPDAITDDSESPEYRTGWNDCRAEMLKGMK